ncbi:hypothetical protein [Streptomyces sp. NPDC056468]
MGSEPDRAAGWIDTEVHPPKILLIRGRAEPDVVEELVRRREEPEYA